MNAELRLARAFLETHASRAAMILERMPTERASNVLGAVPARSAAPVVAAMTPPFAAATVAHLDSGAAAPIIRAMPMDYAAAVLRSLPAERRTPVLAALPAETRDALARAIPYPEGTAGAVMDPSVLHLPEEILIADAQTRIRRSARELLYYLYIVDGVHPRVGGLDNTGLMGARPRDTGVAGQHSQVDRVSPGMARARVGGPRGGRA
jgi:magnesium transporter